MSSKEYLESLLIVGTSIKIGKQYADECGGFEAGQSITLVQGYFERDNGLYDVTETAPSVWNESDKEFDSIYHLFGNNLEHWYDCEIIKPNDNGQ